MLGDLSAQYESTGDPGCIADLDGDPGGRSYGLFQMSTNAGTLNEYLDFIEARGYWFGSELKALRDKDRDEGTEEFDALWKWLADSPNVYDFEESQRLFIEVKFYEPAVQYLADNYFHIDNHNEIIKDVVWSRAVQYGPNAIVEMFEDAVRAMGYPNLSYVDAEEYDSDLIRAVYLDVCSSYEWNHGAYRESLNNRFADECERALENII